MIDNQELEAIRKRVEKTTPGPWYPAKLEDGWHVMYDGYIVAEMYHEREAQDADFIAHAREDVPKMLAEIERLQQEKDEWYEKYMRSDATVSMQYSLLQTANEKLQKAIELLKMAYNLPSETREGSLKKWDYFLQKLNKSGLLEDSE